MNNKTIEEYINFSRYFQTLKDNNIELYKKMVKAFYSYIQQDTRGRE